jgi:thiol-disulfide isomerase/thioredoxin
MKIRLSLLFLLLVTVLRAQHVPVIKITDLEKRINAGNDTTYIINLWATWCAPCVAELPIFEKCDSLHKNEKVKVLLVSMDDIKTLNKKVVPFVKRRKLHSEVLLLDESKADYFLPKLEPGLSGSLPATVILNKATGFRWYVEGQLSNEGQLEEQLKKAQRNP